MRPIAVLRQFLPLLSLCATTPSLVHAQEILECINEILDSPNPEVDGNFGVGLAVDGNTFVVGASHEDGSGLDSGRAYVYERTPSGWTVQELVPQIPLNAHAAYGYRAAIDGNTLAIGAIYDDLGVPPNRAGAVHVFTRQGGTWDWVARIDNPSPLDSDFFGHDIVIDGAKMLIGAPLHDGPGRPDEGEAYMFEFNGTNWGLVQTFQSTQPISSGSFGAFVGLNGLRVVIGAHGEESSPSVFGGAAYVFDYSGSVWSLTQRLTTASPSSDAEFGYYVDIDADWIVIGELRGDYSGSASGAVHVYVNDVGCTPDGILWPNTADLDDFFSAGLQVANNTVVVGSPGDDEAALNAGSFVVFKRSPSGWTERALSTACGYSSLIRYGDGVAFDGTTIVAGSTERDHPSFAGAGTAYALTLSEGQFMRFCAGNGSGTPCPCGNESPPNLNDGCLNTTDHGGRLSLIGSDSASMDDQRLIACNLPANQFGVLFTGTAQVGGGMGAVFGDGLRCAGGHVVRRGPPKLSDSHGKTVWGPGLSVYEPWAVGQWSYFQVWYRNPPGVCDSAAPFNLTCGLGVLFTP